MGDGYFERLSTDPPAMWSLGWVADYPGPERLPGRPAGHGRVQQLRPLEFARPSTPRSPRPSRRPIRRSPASAYDRAEAVVRDEVPVVPVSYGPGWALTRTGLLGAGQNGLGIVRMAGLAWAE